MMLEEVCWMLGCVEEVCWMHGCVEEVCWMHGCVEEVCWMLGCVEEVCWIHHMCASTVKLVHTKSQTPALTKHADAIDVGPRLTVCRRHKG